MAQKTSLKDIAAAAGVSIALVSYVLNDREKEARVNPETAKRIREMAKKMNYQPNQIAKSLKSGKSQAIGLILADISNPFFGHLARTIEDEAKKSGYTVIFGSSDEDLNKSHRLIETLINRQIDGIIIAPAEGSESQLEYLQNYNIPFVLIDRYFKDLETSYVVIDNFKATYQATEQLTNLGHERIAFVCYRNKLQHTEDRYQGYLQALKDHGHHDLEQLLCEVEFNNPVDFDKKFQYLLDPAHQVDAVLFSTNTLSIMGLKKLKAMNIIIPDELAVFCFDESEAYDLFYCTISHVRQPLEEIGQKAVQILFEQLLSRHKINRQVILNSKILVKESSGVRKRERTPE